MEDITNKPLKKEPMSMGKIVLFGVVFFVLLYLYLPIFIFLMAAFVPLLVAIIIDQESEHFASTCVGIGCACGILPPLLDLWDGNFTLETVFVLLRDPLTLFIMTLSAAVGWSIYLIVPRLVSVAYKTWMEIKLLNLKKRQEALVELWGDEIRSETNDQTNSA